jgi:hypothetical protein
MIMKTNRLKQIVRNLGIMAMASLLMIACSKDDADMDSQQTAHDDVLVDELQNYIDLLIESNIDDETIDAGLMAASQYVMAQPYPHIDVEFESSETLWPRIITIDFGPTDIEVAIGNPNVANAPTVWVRGKMVVTKTGPFFSEGSQRTIATDNLYINGYYVVFAANGTNQGVNNSGHYLFDVTSDLSVTDANSNTFTRNATLEYAMTAGGSTPYNIWDDVFVINGTAKGQRISGLNYTHAISQLTVKRSCRYPVSGTIVVMNRFNTFEIDYGQGDCDNLFQVSDENGNVYTLTH